MEREEENFLKWFGGFFDADGSIFWTSQGILVLNISQSEKTVLDMINYYYNNIFTMDVGKSIKSVDFTGSNRTQFSLHKTGKEIYPVLLDLQKYCIIKNPQICLSLEYLKYHSFKDEESNKKRQEIGKKIKQFNIDHTNLECIEKRPYSNLTVQYIAGLFDGDGCVSISKNLKRYAKITQKNDPIMLQKIYEFYPGSSYPIGRNNISFENKDALKTFLNDVLPYIIYKKDQVEYFLRFLETTDDREKIEIRDKLKLLKKFDLDPVKYSEKLKNLFEDLDSNYTTRELMLGKKLKELQECRITKTFDNRVFNDYSNLSVLKPKLIFCESRDQNELWTYFRKRTSSITLSGQVGRSIRILVLDENSDKYIGILSLSSDFYNISARDEFIKKYYPNVEVSHYINNIANVTCCVPLQPFGYNVNGGKLLLKLAFSREVYQYWINRYKEELLIITTLGVNGKSVMYDRLEEIKLVGFTKGVKSSVHVPYEIINMCKILYTHLGLKGNRYGTVDMLNELFKKTKMNITFNKHITPRSVYLGWLFKSKLDNRKPDSNELKTVETITHDWKARWAYTRLENVKKNNTIKTKIELMTIGDEMFKNLKLYALPDNLNSITHFIGKIPIRKVEVFVAEEKVRTQPLILEKLNDTQLRYLMTLKTNVTTEEASKTMNEKYSVIIQRNEISKLWLGEILPSNKVQDSVEYKTAMKITKKRVYKNLQKSEAWVSAVIENRKKTISDEHYLSIMRLKKGNKTAESVSELFSYDSGKNAGKQLNRSTIQDIWSGKATPSIITPEYSELLKFKRTRCQVISPPQIIEK